MKPRILFVGGTPRGFELLKMLVRNRQEVVFAFIMQEDSHETVKASIAIRDFCRKHNIRAKVCRRITPGDAVNLAGLKPDICFVCGWRTIIPAALYDKIPLGCIAAHDSLLPKYRGFAPLNWAVINGEKRTGVTLFKINSGVDSGLVFGSKAVSIGPRETAAEVYPRIIKATLGLYRDFLSALGSGKIRWRRQVESGATYGPRRTPADGEIDWVRPAAEIFNLIRALASPYPCAWTRYKGRILRISAASLPARQFKYRALDIPGKILFSGKGRVVVLCGSGQIVLNKLSVSGNRHLDADRVFSSEAGILGR